MTVRQLTQAIDYDELRGWALFEEQYGPLHASIRVEGAIARAVIPFLKDVTIEQMMLWPKKEEKVATAEDIFNILKAAKKMAKVPVKKVGFNGK